MEDIRALSWFSSPFRSDAIYTSTMGVARGACIGRIDARSFRGRSVAANLEEQLSLGLAGAISNPGGAKLVQSSILVWDIQ